jgi:hypothetical protein
MALVLTMNFSLLLTLLQVIHFQYATARDILVLGDSWGEGIQDWLSGVCDPMALIGAFAGSESQSFDSQNDAKGGTTAAQWASGEMAKSSFENDDFDFVWLSIGGNDFLGNGCDITSKDDISNDIVDVIADIVDSSSNDDIKILYFGYGVPSEEVCAGGNTVPLMAELATHIREKITSSSYADYVQVMDITNEFVTSSSTPFSDTLWYGDDIHLNESGYLKLFSMQPMQEFFGCISSDPDESPSDDTPTVANPDPSETPPSSASLANIAASIAAFLWMGTSFLF